VAAVVVVTVEGTGKAAALAVVAARADG